MPPTPPTLDYAQPRPADLLSHLGRLIHLATPLDVLLAAIFALTRTIQLRQPDPYNNPWTTLSTGALCGFAGLWLLMTTATLLLLARNRRPNVWSTLWILAAGLWIGAMLCRMCMFLGIL